MNRYLIILLLLLLVRPAISQTFLDSYRKFCMDKISSSILQRVKMSADLRTTTHAKVDDWHTQSNKRLDFQIKKLTMLFDTYREKYGYDFNNADSLTIIYQATGNSSLSDFIIWSLTDTLKSINTLALCKEVNNGGGRLEALREGATKFRIHKTYNSNMGEPFLEIISKSDTAYAFNGPVYSPVDVMSIIVTAKRVNGMYRIWAYYLYEFAFVPVLKK